MDRFLRAFSDFIIRHRLLLLAAIVLVTMFFAWQCTRITVNNDMDTWLPERDRTAELIRQADRDFSSNDILFCVVIVIIVVPIVAISIIHPFVVQRRANNGGNAAAQWW